MIDLVKHASHAKTSGDARQKAVDTGMALALICLIVGLARARTGWFAAAAVVLALNMTAPRLFGPLSKLWFGLSGLMGAVMSKVILTIVYFLVLTPVGLMRRVLGKDTLRLAAFKNGQDSVFHARGGPFTSADLKTPF